MKRPKEINDVVADLLLNAIALALGGRFSLFFGMNDKTPVGGALLCFGTLMCFLGIAIGAVTLAFYRLHRFGYYGVSLLVSPFFGLRGDRRYFRDLLKRPQVRQAFGLAPDSNPDTHE